MSAEPIAEQEWLGLAAAARRVKSSKRTVRRWKAQGMPTRMVDGAVYVELETLLAWWRRKMAESPVHQHRIRRRFLDAGQTPPEWNEHMRAQRARAAATRDQRASGSPDTKTDSEAATEQIVTWEDVFRELPPFRGQAEHAALIRAMEQTPAACDGIETFTRDKFNDPDDVAIMRGICQECPVFDLCAAFAAAGKPSAGMWAGTIPTDRCPTSERRSAG